MTQHTFGQPGLKPNDGPAFPCSHGDYMQFGMTLRDYFAGMAMDSRIPADFVENYIEHVVGLPMQGGRRPLTGLEMAALDAAWCYAKADAMLAERAK